MHLCWAACLNRRSWIETHLVSVYTDPRVDVFFNLIVVESLFALGSITR